MPHNPATKDDATPADLHPTKSPIASTPDGGPSGNLWVWYEQDFTPAVNDWSAEDAQRYCDTHS